MQQIDDPRWRGYARLQRALRGRTTQNDVTAGIENALDALLVDRPRTGETHERMGARARESAMRRQRRRRRLDAARDGAALDAARVRASDAPEAAMHARLYLSQILSRASGPERELVLGLALGAPPPDVPPATYRKRLQRFREGLRA